VASGRVDVRSLVTYRFPLAESRVAFEAAARREGLKVLIEP
jgi:threonine dehydrogenase-like Zn-dependent dehydrogenase